MKTSEHTVAYVSSCIEKSGLFMYALLLNINGINDCEHLNKLL